MRRKPLLLCLALLLTISCLSLAARTLERAARPVSGPVSAGKSARPVLILDAGHGGEDGGAVSVTGVPESLINLEIARKLNDLLIFLDRPPVMLRETDISLHSPDAVTLREKKVSDLQNRAAAIREVQNGTLISIHQNSYPDGKYHGTQVFYAPTEHSDLLAGHIQETVQTALQPDNTRSSRPIPDTVYLMNHVDCPAVLVECGFLTNPEEEAMLRDDTYQRKLAAVLASAWLTAEF